MGKIISNNIQVLKAENPIPEESRIRSKRKYPCKRGKGEHDFSEIIERHICGMAFFKYAVCSKCDKQKYLGLIHHEN